MEYPILNNSDVTGRDGYHSTLIGLPWYILKATPDMRSRVLDIRTNWTNAQKTRIVTCLVKTHTDVHRRGSLPINRKTIVDTLQSNGITNYVTSDINGYYNLLLNSKYTICPEGNGIDTHRATEALFCGCIPIIEKNPLIVKKYEGLPVLYTDDYSEVTESYLEEKYLEIMKREYSFNKLYINYMDEDLKNECIMRSDFWIRKRTGQTLKQAYEQLLGIHII